MAHGPAFGPPQRNTASPGSFWIEWVEKRGKKEEVRSQWVAGAKLCAARTRCLPPRRSLQTNSGVAVLMNYILFDVVSCGLVDSTVISLLSTAAVAAALHRTNACRLRLQPLPRARMPVRAVHSMCVTYHLAQTAEQCVRTGGETASTESAAAVASEQNRPARSVCTFCSVPNRPTCGVIMQPWQGMLTAVCNDTVGHFKYALHHGSVLLPDGAAREKCQIFTSCLRARMKVTRDTLFRDFGPQPLLSCDLTAVNAPCVLWEHPEVRRIIISRAFVSLISKLVQLRGFARLMFSRLPINLDYYIIN